MVDSPPDRKAPSKQRTSVRPPPGKGTDLEPTLPLGRRPAQPTPTPAPGRALPGRFHRWLVIAVVAAGLLLSIWWQKIDEEVVPPPPAPAPQAPIAEPRPESPLPADEAGSDYRQRLLALSSLPPPTLSDSEREQRLTALFERFSRAIDSGNLVLPATDSAAEYLLRMTALGAGHPRLLEARSRLAQAFLEEARRARLAGDWDAADRWLQHAVEIRLSLEDLEAEQDSRD